MTRRQGTTGAMAVACLFASAAMAAADVKVQEKTHVKFEGLLGGVVNLFGGKAAKEGVTSTVAVVGDRRARLGDNTGEIVDLSEEKVYELDLKNKTYKVTTFAEMRKRWEEAEEKARENAPEEKSSRAEKDDEAGEPAREFEVDFGLKKTGQKKAVNGFQAEQLVMTAALREKGKTLEQSGGLHITTDMWVAPGAGAAKDVAEFERRYLEKLYGSGVMAQGQAQMAMLLGAYPGLRQGLARMQAEGAKVEGTPVLTTMTIEAVKSPQQMAQAEEQKQEQPGLGGVLGRFGRKKKEEPAREGAAKNRSTLMTSTHEILSVTPEVTAADVAVPAGFKQK